MFRSRTAHALTVAALLFVAVDIDDPYLAPVRVWSGMAIVAIAGIGSMLASLRRDGRAILLVLWCTIPLAQAVVSIRFLDREIGILNTPPARAVRFGQHFVVGYRHVDEIEILAERGLIGGIFVTRRNVAGRGAAALRDEIAHLQAIRLAAGLPPLIVAADQEGGIVTHLSPPLSAWPSLADLAGLPPEQRREQAMAEGAGMGRELAALGVTVDFAPVVDLRPERPHNRFDFNTLIGQRAIASDPAVVTDIALAFGQGLAMAGVRGTIKNFPGLGRVTSDTHHFRAILTADATALDASDWRPFRTILAQSDPLLMVGHVVVGSIDAAHPASQSKAAIDGLLRRQWGFDGVIVTDDLVMTSVFKHGICAGVADSLNAGVDLLLVAYDGRQFYRLMACVLAAEARQEIDPAMLAASERRLRRVLP